MEALRNRGGRSLQPSDTVYWRNADSQMEYGITPGRLKRRHASRVDLGAVLAAMGAFLLVIGSIAERDGHIQAWRSRATPSATALSSRSLPTINMAW